MCSLEKVRAGGTSLGQQRTQPYVLTDVAVQLSTTRLENIAFTDLKYYALKIEVLKSSFEDFKILE